MVFDTLNLFVGGMAEAQQEAEGGLPSVADDLEKQLADLGSRVSTLKRRVNVQSQGQRNAA